MEEENKNKYEYKYKYDVFISAKKNDYNLAGEVRDFLEEKGLNVFFADRSITPGSEILEEIHKALDQSANLFVVCSNANHVFKGREEYNSNWVYDEWLTFDKMILDNEKPEGADIVTIYTPTTDFKALPYRLRKRQCVMSDDYKQQISKYLYKIKSIKGDSEEWSPVPFRGMREKTIWERLRYPLLTGLLGLLLCLGCFYWGCQQNKVSDKTLVLAGGGSVVAFLEQEVLPEVHKDEPYDPHIFSENRYDDAFYLHMPSGYASFLLAEEGIMPYSRENQPFYPVILSAGEADESRFINHRFSSSELLKTGHIVEYWLGEEPLAVYVEKVSALDNILDSTADSITVDQLVRLLKSPDFNIFSTTKKSGTYAAYLDVLDNKCDLDEVSKYDFSSQSDLSWLQHPDSKKSHDKPFVILGSKYYWPIILDKHINKDVRRLMLVDENRNEKMRPLYVYFMAYKDKNRQNRLFIPDEVFDFLKFIGFKKSDLIDEKTHEFTVPVDKTDELIIPINGKQ